MSVADNIVKLRKKRGLTQLELSKKVGVSQSMIAQIERGTKVPALTLGKAIADVLGCSIDALVTDLEKED